MKIFVFADRLGQELQPLTDRTCPALLPVAGKPLLEHTIESLALADLKDITLIAANYADQIRLLLADGRRWGVNIHYLSSRGEAEPGLFLQRQAHTVTSPYLVLRGDILRNPCVQQFAERAAAVEGAVVQATIDHKPAALCLVRSLDTAALEHLAWPVLTQAQVAPGPTVALADARISYIESLPAYHAANLDAIADAYPGLIIPGRRVANNMRLGRNSKIALRDPSCSQAFIGENSTLNEQVELSGRVVISDHTIIDKQASLKDTVVLPHTYVGEMVNLENAIVRSNDLIRVDTGAIVRVTDTFLLSDLQTNTLSATLADPLHRLLAAILLLCSLPLWPLAALAALLESPAQPLQSILLRGNKIRTSARGEQERLAFTGWYWSTAIPVLRQLPMLLASLQGHLRLVGSLPLTPADAAARTEEWELLADQAPAGLIGPTQLNVPASAPIEEKLLSDAFYAKHRSSRGDLVLLWQGLLSLFSKRAWLPHRNT